MRGRKLQVALLRHEDRIDKWVSNIIHASGTKASFQSIYTLHTDSYYRLKVDARCSCRSFRSIGTRHTTRTTSHRSNYISQSSRHLHDSPLLRVGEPRPRSLPLQFDSQHHSKRLYLTQLCKVNFNWRLLLCSLCSLHVYGSLWRWKYWSVLQTKSAQLAFWRTLI